MYNDNIKQIRFWCQKVLPLVYDDSLSYYELLCKVTDKLNQLIESNNSIPDLIIELIKEYINSGEIGEIIKELLSNYLLNVKYPPNNIIPAKGDGVTDDTESIQACIDYAFNNGGMCLIFPSGTYIVSPLTLKDNVSLCGFDRYTTKLVLKANSNSALLNGSVKNMSINKLGLDGNIQNQNLETDTVNMSWDDCIIENSYISNGFNLLEINVTTHAQINSVIMEYCVETSMIVSGEGFVQCNNLIFKEISILRGKNFITINCSNSVFSNLALIGESPLGINITGNNNTISFYENLCQTDYSNSGLNNSIINQGKNLILNNSESIDLNSVDILLNPTNPLSYKEPNELNEYFNYVPFKHNGVNYNVLVEGQELLELSSQINFASVEDMLESNKNFKLGEIIITGSYKNIDVISCWKVINHQTDDLMHLSLKNGLTAEYVRNSEFLNVNSVGIVNDYTNVSDSVQWLLNNKYLNLYFPKGYYTLSVNLPANTTIVGDNEQLTRFIPYNHGKCINISADFINLENLYIYDVSPFNGVGIEVTNNGTRHSNFRNIVIENCGYGFASTGTMIWCRFYNVAFYGNTNNGFFMRSSTGFFNLNTFYSCRFNNNVNYAIIIDVTKGKNFCNNFIGCNIELNCQDRFGVKHSVTSAVYNTAFTNFIGCYFEYNGQIESECTIKNYDTLNLIGCVFILEKNLVNTDDLNKLSFIGCKDYEISGYYITNTDGNLTINYLANDFSKPILGNKVINNMTNKKLVGNALNGVLNCNNPVNMTALNITSLSNAVEGQIVYLYAATNITIASSIMTTSSIYNLKSNSIGIFLVLSGKLSPINMTSGTT